LLLGLTHVITSTQSQEQYEQQQQQYEQQQQQQADAPKLYRLFCAVLYCCSPFQSGIC